MINRNDDLSGAAIRLPHVVLELLPSLPARVLRLLAERSIDLLDKIDPDSDFEDDNQDRGEDEDSRAA